ncbi:hypothetical protein NTH_02966 [Nitratireductor thuwali]|uniref:Uncharacterized protein n=1 Tax=Nitratireductor thuwali TaxID=2267699 RepID=A0ABY5MM70_9HYPH|nr:hypothetical protein NTH_02966 [Nitratireductor thuwali]
MRLRTTALPTFLVTVMPRRGGPSSPRSSTSSRKRRPRRLSPRRTARNSARLVRRAGKVCGASPVDGPVNAPAPRPHLGGKPLAAPVAARRNDTAATGGSHARAEAMPALADDFRGLICALHLFKYRGVRPFLGLFVVGSFRGNDPTPWFHATPDGKPVSTFPGVALTGAFRTTTVAQRRAPGRSARTCGAYTEREAPSQRRERGRFSDVAKCSRRPPDQDEFGLDQTRPPSRLSQRSAGMTRRGAQLPQS